MSNNHVIWLVGLSASGKTTIGRDLVNRLRALDRPTVFIDGDEIRSIFKHDDLERSYSVEERRKNAERIFEMTRWLHRQEVTVVCSILCIFQDILDANAEAYGELYKEIYIQASLEAVAQRSPKDLYGKARRGEMNNVVGLDIPYPPPKAPSLTIDNDVELVNLEDASTRILELL